MSELTMNGKLKFSDLSHEEKIAEGTKVANHHYDMNKKILAAMEELTFYPVEGTTSIERVEKMFKIKINNHSNMTDLLLECLDESHLIEEKALEYWRIYQSASFA